MKKYLILYVTCFPLCLSYVSFAQNQPAYRDSLKALINTQKADTSLVNTYNKLASYYARANSDSALITAQQALSVSKKLQYRAGIADALMVISKYHRSRGDFPVALENCLKSLHEYEALKSIKAIAAAQIEIAQLYKDLSGQNSTGEYINTGINYGKSAWLLYSSIADTAGMANSLSVQGIFFRDKAKALDKGNYYDTALYLYNKAFDLINQSGKGTEYIGKLYNNISQVYLEYKNDYHTALNYLFKAVAFNQKNNTPSLSYNYGNIANAYSSLNDYANSLKYARLMLNATLQQGAPSRIQNAYQQLYNSFKASGQMDSALGYYVLADRLNDSLTNLAKTQQVMNLQVQYETEKKESEIKRLNISGAEKNKRIAILIFIVVIIAGLAGAMLWLYQRVKNKSSK